MTDWQPIDTAPKDGKWLLLFGDGVAMMQCPFVGRYDRGKEMWREVRGKELNAFPTHWMPLPEPPNV